tara:strand:+ start:1076 stop:1261 length:186 start_codon:yes stop_codon:yes gene_type:complete
MYTVQCPALGEEEMTNDLDRATDVCYSMAEESGSWAGVRDIMGDVIIEYGDIMQAVANGDL